MTKNSLSRLLKPYGIRPNTVRVGYATQTGYPVKDFSEAFSRYIPDSPVSTVTSSQASDLAGSGRDASEIENVTVTVETSHRNVNETPKASNGAGCDGVTDEMPKEDF